MWIKTQGGYLLNLDKVEFVIYDSGDNNTYAYGKDHNCYHIISEGNCVNNVRDGISSGAKIMEVR